MPLGIAVESFKTKEELENERIEYEEVLALGKSMWLTDLYVNRPWLVVIAGGMIIGFFTVLCLAF